MKNLYRILLGIVLLGGAFSPTAWSEGEIEGCGEDQVDCETCINEAVRRAKATVVAEADDSSDEQSGANQKDI